MIIDFNKYLPSLSQCNHVFKTDRAKKDPIAICTEIAIGSMVPVIAVYAYAMQPDIMDAKEKLSQGYENIKKFYGYTHIIEFKGQ